MPQCRRRPTVQEHRAIMAARTSGRTRLPYIAVVVGGERERSRVVNCLMSFYRFAEYADSSQAIAACGAYVPHLAVVSEELPGSSGFDFVRKLRLNSNLAAVPVVMVVARDDNVTRNGVAQ